jgi:hypothetical protein
MIMYPCDFLFLTMRPCSLGDMMERIEINLELASQDGLSFVVVKH